jgi:hypothetical protein
MPGYGHTAMLLAYARFANVSSLAETRMASDLSTCPPDASQARAHPLPPALGLALHAPDVPPCACFAGTPAARSAVAGLGAGVGIGMGYTDCKHEFDLVDKAAEAK